MAQVRLVGAQLDTVVGDLRGNVGRIIEALRAAEEADADLCVTPELAITGYPPEDLLLKPGFVSENLDALTKVATETSRCALVVGFVDRVDAPPRRRDPPGPGPVLANAAAICAGGGVVGVYHKRRLPNYGVFDERRWFRPGDGPVELFEIGGSKVGVSICEDVWEPGGPVARLGSAGADLVVNLNASPYSIGRRAERLAMLCRRAAEAQCTVAYVNQVGGQDELVFDGASMVVDRHGEILGAGVQFAPDLVVVDLPPPFAHRTATTDRQRHRVGPVRSVRVSGASPTRSREWKAAPVPAPLDAAAEVYEALVLGTRDYLAKNGFPDAVVGLSGGIDSSLVATIAVDALGSDHVHGIAMPSRYSSDASTTDASALADRLGIEFVVAPIEPAHHALSIVLDPVLGHRPSGLTDENLQSRLRGVLLMAVSNARGWIVLTTGNKSEMATGYSTLYGDSAGGFAVIKDVPKTLVYELCHFRNGRAESRGEQAPIPHEVIAKAPSAELRPDQRDDQSLPPYPLLDPVLRAYVELDQTAGELVRSGFAPDLVDQVVRLVDGAEYKRRQMPPGVRISTKAFGKDRRLPITNHYRPQSLAEARSGG